MRVLCTGAAGFIGSHVVDAVLERGMVPVVFDLLTHAASATDYVADRVPPSRFHVGDVRNRVDVAAAFESIDLVLHLAAQSHVDVSIEDPTGTMSTNADGTLMVARYAAHAKVPMVYVSTDEVHGDVWGTRWHGPGAEEFETPLAPSSPYSAGKAAGEMAVHACARTFGLRAAIVRGCNAFGPRQTPEKLIPIACRLLQRGEPVPLHGGGLQERQWIHASDFAEVILAAAHRLLTSGGPDVAIWNAAGPRRETVLDLVMALAGAAGVGPAQAVRAAPDRPGQDRAYHLSGQRTMYGLGVTPTRDLLDHLDELLQAYPADGEVRLASFAASAV